MEKVAEAVVQEEAEDVGVEPFTLLSVARADWVKEEVTEAVGLSAEEGELLALEQALVEACGEREAQAVAVTAPGVGVLVAVHVSVTTREAEEEGVTLKMVTVGAPLGDTVGEVRPEALGLGVEEMMGEVEGEIVPASVEVGLGEEATVSVAVSESAAEAVKTAVGEDTLLTEGREEVEAEREPAEEAEAVVLRLPSPLMVMVEVTVCVGDWLPVTLPLPLLLAVAVMEMVVQEEAVEEGDKVPPRGAEAVAALLALAVPAAQLMLPVCVPVAVTVGETSAALAVAPVGEAVAGRTVGLPLRDSACVGEVLGVRRGEEVVVRVPPPAKLALDSAVTLTVGVTEGVEEEVAEWDGEVLRLAFAKVPLPSREAEEVLVGEMVEVCVVVPAGVEEAQTLTEALTVPSRPPACPGLALAQAVGVEVTLKVAVGGAERVRVGLCV